MARIDLQAAFYNVPLPPRLDDVSAFRFQGKMFKFNVLPMGLFVSPALLQAVVQEAVREVQPGPQRQGGRFAWVHLGDILLVAEDLTSLHDLVTKIVRKLHQKGFYISPRKSVLRGTQRLNYCGISIDTAQRTFEVSTSRLNFFKELLQSPQRFTAQAWGYLGFWLYAIGLSSVSRLLLQGHARTLVKILESGPWLLPRPPEDVWATDASMKLVAVISKTQCIYKGPAFASTIYDNEQLALFVAAYFAPRRTLILCDNTAVLGALC